VKKEREGMTDSPIRGPEIEGPLFLGKDTHALSVPALDGALEVLAANGVES